MSPLSEVSASAPFLLATGALRHRPSDQVMYLRPQHAKALQVLGAAYPNAVSLDTFLEKMDPDAEIAMTHNNVRIIIHRLRRQAKDELKLDYGAFIKAVYGYGYQLVAPMEFRRAPVVVEPFNIPHLQRVLRTHPDQKDAATIYRALFGAAYSVDAPMEHVGV